jgi:hypothetical protein
MFLNKESAPDVGSSCASMNRTGKTNAKKGPKNYYNAYKDFHDREIDSHIIASFMKFAGMKSINGKIYLVACDVTLSVYPHRASLKNMPDHGGNRTYDLWNTSNNIFSYTVINCTSIVEVQVQLLIIKFFPRSWNTKLLDFSMSSISRLSRERGGGLFPRRICLVSSPKQGPTEFGVGCWTILPEFYKFM